MKKLEAIALDLYPYVDGNLEDDINAAKRRIFMEGAKALAKEKGIKFDDDKTDLEIMNEMVNTNNQGIKCSTTIAAMQLKTKKKIGEVTMVIDETTYHQLSKSFVHQTGEYAVGLYVVNMKEFNKIKNRK